MKVKKTYSIYLLLLITLFFPIKYIEVYNLIIILALINVSITYGFAIPKTNAFFLFSIFYFLLVIATYIGIFYYGTDPLRNITEIVRFFPVFIIISSFKLTENKFLLKYMANVFLIYSLITLTISFLQVFSPDIIDKITSIYSAPNHIENSLGASSRALGLSPGPGQNGLIMAVIFAFSISQILTAKIKFKYIILAAISFTTIVLSQSQTAFIIALICFVYALLFSIFFLQNKQKNIAFRYALLTTPIAFFITYHFRENLKYLFSLFTYGLERSSYQARLENTEEIYQLIFDNPVTIIFGHGKDYFGTRAGHMDNEYIFYLGVYGLLASLMIISFYIYVLFMPYISNRKSFIDNGFSFPLHLIVLIGVISAWPSSFILDSRTLIIISIIFIMHIRSARSLI